MLARALRRLKAKIDSTTGTLETMGEALVSGAIDEGGATVLAAHRVWTTLRVSRRRCTSAVAAELRHDPAVG